MSNVKVAETLMTAMLDGVKEKVAAGNYSEAIKAATSFIGSIENNDTKVHKVFGANLVPLYCLRAKSYFEIGSQSNSTASLDTARQDIINAAKALDEYYKDVESTQAESIRTSINNMISTDEQLRADSFAVISQIGTTIKPPSGSPSNSKVDGRSFAGLSTVFVEKWEGKALIFLVGAILWFIPLVLMAYGNFGIGFAIGIVLWFFCMLGWDSFPIGGGGGTQLKMMATWFLMATIIGMIPIAYWTGKTVLRWLLRL